jgi:hypothetical protein
MTTLATVATVTTVAIALLFALDRNTRLWLRARQADARAAEATTRAVRAEEALNSERIATSCARLGRDRWRRRYQLERKIRQGLQHILRVEHIQARICLLPAGGALGDPHQSLMSADWEGVADAGSIEEFTHERETPLVDDGGAR